MTQFIELIVRERQQYLAYLAISGTVLLLAGIVYLSKRVLFERYLGKTDPLVVLLIVIALGFLLLAVLLSRGGWSIYAPGQFRELAPYFGLAAVFGLVAILVDLKGPFPADMNAAFPESLAFYPVMGFGVEILFHVVPLAVLLPILTSVFKGMGQDTAIWIAIGLVALLEPAFQTVTGRPAGSVPLWTTAVVALNIFLINLTQLVLFKRFDFVTMYAFRLAYYAIWHVAWGHFRLGILF